MAAIFKYDSVAMDVLHRAYATGRTPKQAYRILVGACSENVRFNMNAQIGSIVEFRHAGVNWRGRVFNIVQHVLQIAVDGYEATFLIPKDYSRLWVISK